MPVQADVQTQITGKGDVNDPYDLTELQDKEDGKSKDRTSGDYMRALLKKIARIVEDKPTGK